MAYELDKDKQLFEYHNVFATGLAVYINLRKDIDASITTVDTHLKNAKRNEAIALLKSNLIYAIMLKRNEHQNRDIPTKNYVDLINWIEDKMDEF